MHRTYISLPTALLPQSFPLILISSIRRRRSFATLPSFPCRHGISIEARDETRRVLPVFGPANQSSCQSIYAVVRTLSEVPKVLFTEGTAHTDSSPPSSPVRKRQRLSSPTYDDQLGYPSQEDLAAYDELDYKLSQSSQSPTRSINARLPSSGEQPLNQLLSLPTEIDLHIVR